MIKAFYFDYHGVIAKDGSAKKSLRDLANGIITNDEVNDRWVKAKLGTKNQLSEYCKGVVNEKDYLNKFKSETVFWDKEVFVLSSLKKKYKLAVLSNHIPQILDFILKDSDLEKYFEKVIVSGNNLEKPNKKFYDLALKGLNMKSSECVFIDDKLDNIDAANKLGFVTIWLNNPITKKANPDELVKRVKPKFTITEFKEILEVEKKL
jgi:HAD superfamily hydrolase (TIGR01509 family)